MFNWEELIYEGRNKLYGSYFLRKNQTKYLMIGVLIAIMLVCIPLVCYWYNVHQLAQDLEIPETIPVFLGHPEEFEKIMEPPPPTTSVHKDASNSSPVVSDSVPEIKKTEPKPVIQEKDTVHIEDKKDLTTGNGLEKGNDSTLNLSNDQMPQYVGGYPEMINFIRRNTLSAVKSMKSGFREKMNVSFLIDKEGNVKDVRILQGINPELDNAVAKVIHSMPKWIPGRRSGKPAPIREKLALFFNN